MRDITILCTTSSFNASNFPENAKVIRNPYKRRLSEEEVLGLIAEHKPDGIIAGVEPITRRVLEGAPELKVISRCGVGLDSVDLTAASEMGISIFNTPEAPVRAVGELAAAMIFSLVRGLYRYDREMKSHKWEKYTGGLMSEQTIGIIGCGRIGSFTAELLRPASCDIIGYDPYLESHPVIMLESFDYLLRHSDVISLHLPYCDENRHIIDADAISHMKKGTHLVNTSRGGLIDEDALYRALKSGHLGGAGLDVYEEEPYSGPLINLDNVILTPHIASTAGRSRITMEEEAVNNLVKGLSQSASSTKKQDGYVH